LFRHFKPPIVTLRAYHQLLFEWVDYTAFRVFATKNFSREASVKMTPLGWLKNQTTNTLRIRKTYNNGYSMLRTRGDQQIARSGVRKNSQSGLTPQPPPGLQSVA
jgi:hypothetical protein